MKFFGSILFCSRNDLHFRFAPDVNMEEQLPEILTLYDPNIALRKEQKKVLVIFDRTGGDVVMFFQCFIIKTHQ